MQVLQRVPVLSADREVTVLNADQLLTFPDLLAGFEIAAGRLFES